MPPNPVSSSRTMTLDTNAATTNMYTTAKNRLVWPMT